LACLGFLSIQDGDFFFPALFGLFRVCFLTLLAASLKRYAHFLMQVLPLFPKSSCKNSTVVTPTNRLCCIHFPLVPLTPAGNFWKAAPAPSAPCGRRGSVCPVKVISSSFFFPRFFEPLCHCWCPFATFSIASPLPTRFCTPPFCFPLPLVLINLSPGEGLLGFYVVCFKLRRGQ